MTSPSRPYTIIEAGFTTYPSIGVPGRRSLVDGQQYIAMGLFDGSEAVAAGTRFFMDMHNGLEEGTRFVVRGSMDNMPFADNTAEEILVPNLFGDPFFSHIERAATEIVRVLRPAGRLTVIETTTPGVVTADDLAQTLGPFSLRHTNPGQVGDAFLIQQYSDVQKGYVATFELV